MSRLNTFSAAVLVVDGDRCSRAALAEIFSWVGCDVLEAPNGAAALRAMTESSPEIVVADVDLPDTSGYELCHELRKRFGEALAIVLVSADRTDSHDRIAGLLVGADEYLAKPVDSDELLARMRRLLSRTRAGNAAPAESPLDRLTGREREILALLAAGHDQREIANALVISEKTVGTHLQRVLGKLGVHSRAQAVAVALGDGLLDVSPVLVGTGA
jgi:two-component system, NarL family, nitrate/nitrite response regulator NarL